MRNFSCVAVQFYPVLPLEVLICSLADMALVASRVTAAILAQDKIRSAGQSVEQGGERVGLPLDIRILPGDDHGSLQRCGRGRMWCR